MYLFQMREKEHTKINNKSDCVIVPNKSPLWEKRYCNYDSFKVSPFLGKHQRGRSNSMK